MIAPLIAVLAKLPSNVVGKEVFAFLAGHDVARLDSANVNNVTRKTMQEWFKLCFPICMEPSIEQKDPQLEGWEWFLKRGIAIVVSGHLNLKDLVKLTHNGEQLDFSLLKGKIHLATLQSNGFAGVLGVPSIAKMIKSISIHCEDCNELLLFHLPFLTSLETLTVRFERLPAQAGLAQILEAAPPVKELTVVFPIPLSSDERQSLLRHMTTVEFLSLSPSRGTVQELWQFIAQHGERLRVIHLHHETYFSIPTAECVQLVARGCRKLEQVYFHAAPPAQCDVLVEFAEHCPNLWLFETLQTVPLTDAALCALAANCKNFQCLRFATWAVTSECIMRSAEVQAALARLQSLTLELPSGADVSSEGCMPALLLAMKCLRDLRDLRSLTLFLEGHLLVSAVAAVATCCTQLRTVRLVANSDGSLSFHTADSMAAGGDGLAALVAANRALEELEVPCKGWFRDEVVYTIARCCPFLRTLCVPLVYVESTALTDAAVTALASGCSRLTRLTALSGPALTDTAVLALAENCPGLTEVELEQSPLITEVGFTALVMRCKDLRTLRAHHRAMDGTLTQRLEGIVRDEFALRQKSRVGARKPCEFNIIVPRVVDLGQGRFVTLQSLSLI